MACWRAMADAETDVCRMTKLMVPAMRTSTALIAVTRELLDVLSSPISPKLRISNRPPKISPRMPASDSRRLVVSE